MIVNNQYLLMLIMSYVLKWSFVFILKPNQNYLLYDSYI